ncbi:hypothetical protein B0T10DRAFT_465918 [Thelonectria olida]|uniref:Uncharacterized protein n=1 Tax=Thelonectria olida TaxID=1576542 RepID=A0A9P9AL53_9HYPO|nr:hypothetical protein B0T10DRAFT_465918 [Thelonectria olida]
MPKTQKKQLGNLERDRGRQDNEGIVQELESPGANTILPTDWAFEAASFDDRAIRSMITALQSIASCSPAETTPSQRLHKQEGRCSRPTSCNADLASLRVDGQPPLKCGSNLTYLDYVTSYTENDKTRLVLADACLWQVSGLSFTQIMDSIVTDDQDSAGRQASNPAHRCCDPCVSPVGESASWERVDRYLNDWYSALPDTFEPCLKDSQPHREVHSHNIIPGFPLTGVQSCGALISGHFIANPMGAAALPLYHFARILYLLHSPLTKEYLSTGTGSTRLQSHRQFSRHIKYHAEEICATAVGLPSTAVLMHLIQPLRVAGLCLDSEESRSIIAEMLVDLQHRTGFTIVWY